MHIAAEQLDKIQDALMSRDPVACTVAQSFIVTAKDARAAPALIEAARGLYADGSDNDLEIDDDAGTSPTDDGTWVQAWVWIGSPAEDEESTI